MRDYNAKVNKLPTSSCMASSSDWSLPFYGISTLSFSKRRNNEYPQLRAFEQTLERVRTTEYLCGVHVHHRGTVLLSLPSHDQNGVPSHPYGNRPGLCGL